MVWDKEVALSSSAVQAVRVIAAASDEGSVEASFNAQEIVVNKGDLIFYTYAGASYIYFGLEGAPVDSATSGDFDALTSIDEQARTDSTDALTGGAHDSTARAEAAAAQSTADSKLSPTGDGSGLSGVMTTTVYDPQGVVDDPFARGNHTGTQLLATISDAGTAAGLDVGTAANEVVQLDGTGKLPAISGENLTNLPIGMDAAVYDPQGVADDAFARAFHTGTEPDSAIAASSVTQHSTEIVSAIDTELGQTEWRAAPTLNDWNVGGTLADGVSVFLGDPRVITPEGATDVARQADFTQDTTATRNPRPDDANVFTPLETDEVGLMISGTTGTVLGHTVFDFRVSEHNIGLLLVPDGSSPAVSTGETIYVVWPVVVPKNEISVRIHVAVDSSDVAYSDATYGSIIVDLTDGSVTNANTWETGTGTIGDHLVEPDATKITVKDWGTDGDGDLIRGLVMEVDVNDGGAGAAAAGWFVSISSNTANATWAGDGTDVYLRMARPVIYVGTEAPTLTRGGGWEVTDPSVGTHVEVVPMALMATSVKPGEETLGALEIIGTNSGAGLVARLDVTGAGEPQLYVSEDGGGTSYTMSLPVESWTTGVAGEWGLTIAERRNGQQEAVVYVDGVAITGIAILDPPTITDYRSKLSNATAVLDGTGIPDSLDGGLRGSINQAEIDALNTDGLTLSGLSYATLGAAA